MIIYFAIAELHQLNEAHQKCLAAEKAKLDNMKEKVDPDPVKSRVSSQQTSQGSLLKINFYMSKLNYFLLGSEDLVSKSTASLATGTDPFSPVKQEVEKQTLVAMEDSEDLSDDDDDCQIIEQESTGLSFIFSLKTFWFSKILIF